ncbi:transposase [Candidiatus Paracoxiella cheracis]|uniref:transposase n=3 Tax=Candidiatus Paracoxiella cheracis TaxID=3405120 RepID=UPI003BF519FD
MLATEKLKQFRTFLYNIFPARRDANMNLLDALSSHGHRCKTPIELCESPYFEREYSSITDAISDGLSVANCWDSMMKIQYEHVSHSDDRVIIIADTTPQSRQSAHCVEDRHVVYSPNPAPGNKPITIGHEYSTVSLLPNDGAAQEKHWLVPLDTRRVKSDEKGNVVGMQQINRCIADLALTHKLVVSVADSKYGTEACRKLVSENPNWVHLFRFNSTRNVFAPASIEDNTSGSIKRYGDAMKLNDSTTHRESDEIVQQPITTRSGKTYQLEIKIWRDQLLRGSKQFKGYEHPVTVVQLVAVDANGKSLYKNPLWLGLAGERRNEITALEAYHYYDRRYDIEHYFRFGKDKLLFDRYQTPDVKHEEDWWRMTALAYTQLYLARNLAPILPKKWERYLPSFQVDNEKPSITATPSQTQRGFSTVLDTVGTPANLCKPRGNPQGRTKGDTQGKRTRHPAIFKNSNSKIKTIQRTEEKTQNSDPEKIEDLIGIVKSWLDKINFTPEKFYELLQKTA